jgi:hypothetical protein
MEQAGGLLTVHSAKLASSAETLASQNAQCVGLSPEFAFAAKRSSRHKTKRKAVPRNAQRLGKLQPFRQTTALTKSQ